MLQFRVDFFVVEPEVKLLGHNEHYILFQVHETLVLLNTDQTPKLNLTCRYTVHYTKLNGDNLYLEIRNGFPSFRKKRKLTPVLINPEKNEYLLKDLPTHKGGADLFIKKLFFNNIYKYYFVGRGPGSVEKTLEDPRTYIFQPLKTVNGNIYTCTRTVGEYDYCGRVSKVTRECGDTRELFFLKQTKC